MDLPQQVYNYTTKNYDLGLLLDYSKANRIDTNLDCQRGYVWTPHQKQQLIDTLINRERIPEFHAIREQNENIFHFADGKQRITTILNFLNNELAWEKNEADPKFHELFNKQSRIYFKDLPVNFQHMITGTEVPIATYSNMTPTSITKLFRKLNNGTALKEFQKSLAENISIKKYFLDELMDHPAIAKIFSESRIQKGNAEQALIRIMILCKRIDEGESDISCDLCPPSLENHYLDVEKATDEEIGRWIKFLNKYQTIIKKYLDWLDALDPTIDLRIRTDYIFIFSLVFAYKENLTEDTLKALWMTLNEIKASDIIPNGGADFSRSNVRRYINYIQNIISNN